MFCQQADIVVSFQNLLRMSIDSHNIFEEEFDFSKWQLTRLKHTFKDAFALVGGTD